MIDAVPIPCPECLPEKSCFISARKGICTPVLFFYKVYYFWYVSVHGQIWNCLSDKAVAASMAFSEDFQRDDKNLYPGSLFSGASHLTLKNVRFSA